MQKEKSRVGDKKNLQDPRIAFFGELRYTFVKRDHEILSKHYEVDVTEQPKIKTEWIKYPSLVKKKVKGADLVFGWFAGWHTLPAVHYARRYKKPSVIVVGGYDAVSLPEIKYGAFSNFKERVPARYVLRNASKLLPVSNYLKREIIKNARVSGRKIYVVPTGYNTNFWKPGGKKENVVLTVASAKDDLRRIKVKGLDTFVKTARYLPNTKFILIGVRGECEKFLKKIAPSNVEIVGYVPHKKLLSYYQKAKIYAQLSLSEGLPNTLCEAMLAEDIPVGTGRGGIPEVMGDVGFYVPYGDPKATAEAIKMALEETDDLGKKARERIMKLFPESRREKEIINVIEVMFKQFNKYMN